MPDTGYDRGVPGALEGKGAQQLLPGELPQGTERDIRIPPGGENGKGGHRGRVETPSGRAGLFAGDGGLPGIGVERPGAVPGAPGMADGRLLQGKRGSAAGAEPGGIPEDAVGGKAYGEGEGLPADQGQGCASRSCPS